MRYYYTDKLAAKWMKKNFGMKFLDVWDGEFNVVPLNQREIEKFYIHPDSLNFLEPMVGDIVKTNKGLWTLGQSVIFADNSPHGEMKIIQRNNIAFMWPKVEND